MTLKHNYVYESRCIQLVYLRYLLYENKGFVLFQLDTQLLTSKNPKTQTVKYITRRAKWSEVKKLFISSAKCEKCTTAET